MKRQKIIVVISEGEVETYGNLKKVCLAKNLSYYTLRYFKFPIFYKGFAIYKTDFL